MRAFACSRLLFVPVCAVGALIKHQTVFHSAVAVIRKTGQTKRCVIYVNPVHSHHPLHHRSSLSLYSTRVMENVFHTQNHANNKAVERQTPVYCRSHVCRVTVIPGVGLGPASSHTTGCTQLRQTPQTNMCTVQGLPAAAPSHEQQQRSVRFWWGSAPGPAAQHQLLQTLQERSSNTPVTLCTSYWYQLLVPLQ